MENKNILALDLGIKMGWAVCLRDGSIDSGSINLSCKISENKAIRFISFKDKINHLMNRYDIQAVFYEEVKNHKGVIASHVYGAFEALLQVICYIRKCEVSGVGVGVIKKSATGKGNASKEMMISAAIDKGYTVTDDNQADAVHLLLHVIDKINTGCEVMG